VLFRAATQSDTFKLLVPRGSKDPLGIFFRREDYMLKPYNPVQQSSRGLGDTVANVAKKLGFKQTEGCGCQKRQEALNRLVPYGKKGAK